MRIYPPISPAKGDSAPPSEKKIKKRVVVQGVSKAAENTLRSHSAQSRSGSYLTPTLERKRVKKITSLSKIGDASSLSFTDVRSSLEKDFSWFLSDGLIKEPFPCDVSSIPVDET